MTPDAVPNERTLVAQLLGEALRQAQGQPGVLVRDVPHLDAAAVLSEMARILSQDIDLRIAYLNPAAASEAPAAGISDEVFTTRVEDAEAWRNTRGLHALIVVITESDAAKLTSLEEFVPIGSALLRRFLVERAATEFGEANEVLPRWWTIIGGDDQISFSDLVDYYLALEPLDGPARRDQAALQINRLGLLPDPGFFDNPGERQLRKRLDDNRALALRLANFSEEDRQKVDKALAAETDTARRSELRERLRDLQEYRRGGRLGLSATDARQLLRVKSGTPPPPAPPPGSGDEAPPAPPSPPPPPKNLTALAVENLLGEDGEDDDVGAASLDHAITELRAQLDDIDSSTVRPEPVSVNLPSGAQVDEVVSTDVVNLVNRLLGEGRYGGLIKSRGDNIASMIRNFQQTVEVLRNWDRDRVDEFLTAFAEHSEAGVQVRDAFDAFDAARNDLLPHVGELCVAPLLVTTAAATRSLVPPIIDAYRSLLTATEQAYGALHEAFGDDARNLVELLMLTDTVFLDNGETVVALLTPLHPLLLWHYYEYTRVIESQKDLLEPRDHDLVRSEFASGGIPFFFASIGVPRLVSEHAPSSLPFTGRAGGLPHFSEQADARDPTDGLRPIRRLAEAYVALEPAAAEGLRLALLEPPDAGTYLSMCCDLADAERLRGAHVTVLRRGQTVGAELNLSGDEERRVQQRFGNHNERRFTFESWRVGPTPTSPPDSLTPHIFVAFDQTERTSADAGAALQKIQPLANRRRLVYRIGTHSLDLEPALGGILAEYSSLAGLAIGKKIVSYQTMHQTTALERQFTEAAKLVPWYVVADGHVDRDLDVGALRVLTDREGTRDIVAFTRSPAAFRRSLREVLRQFNTFVTDDQLDVLLTELSDLLDAGLLTLRPGRSGEVVQPHVRGLLGLLVAVQSLRAMTPEGHDRIILSLDSGQARRWLHLADDPYRADLLVIDGADDRFGITVVEVKTRQDTTSEYAINAGQVSGPAITQMLSTHRILRQVFDPGYPDLLVTPSRREILREHLYRELSKTAYPNETKQRWAKRSEQLFDGTPDVDLRCALIEVHLGTATASLEPLRNVSAADGDHLVPVAIINLNEDGVTSLEAAMTPPPEPPQPEPPADDQPTGGAPPSGSGGGMGASPAITPPAPSRRPPEPSLPEVPSNSRVLLGTSSASGHPRDVWFDPQSPDQPLSNPHISISGETGSGKTQAVKAILHDFLPRGVPALILDFKDDYSKADFAQREGFTVHDATYGSLPFNPMVPPIDPETGRANPISHVHELGNMLQRIYKLGDQQAFQLREAMKETYEIAGIGFKPFTPEPDQRYLPFEAIRDVLVREEATQLLGRLSPVFDLGLFSLGDAASTLNDLLSQPTVIRLSQLPGDQVKNAVAEFFLMALYSFLIRREHPHRLERLLVLDEAWRLVQSPFLEPIMREGRAFGLGVMIATQFPRDLPDSIAGSTATRVFFNQTKAEQVREIQRTLVGKTSGTEADHLGNLIRGLAPLECILQNLQYRPWIRLRAIPYFSRVAEQADQE
ncbi:MAG: ATP-binding protein [Actinomycetota bacterium]|nr:ATP-binding protein [Actinomycetota bacterium]